MRWCPVMLLLLFPSLAVAWPVGGARLTGAFDEQVGPEIMADGSGGAYVSWADWRDFIASQSNLSDLYMQHVTSSGDIAPGWPMDGLRIAGGSGTQGSVWRMTPDGVGGVLIVYGDTQVDFGDLYLQRVTADGAVAPGWPVGGVPVGLGPGQQFAPELTGDGAGGAFVSWQDSDRAGTSRARLSHVLGNGQLAPGWPANGRLFEPSSFQVGRPLLSASPGGGFLACWGAATDPRGYFLVRVLAQRFGADGAPALGWPAGGLEIVPPLFSSRGPVASLVPDGAGGFYTLIDDYRASPAGDPFSEEDLYAQHVLGDGTLAPGWPADGLPVSARAGSWEQLSTLCEDGTGGLYVAWEDYRDPAPRVYMQHVRADGTLSAGWPEGGRALLGAADEFGLSPKLAWDGMSGAFVTWMTLGAGGYRSRVQHVNADGSPGAGWPPEGRPVTTLETSQYVPRIAGDGHGNAIVAWEDTRGGERDVYAQQFTYGFVVAVTASVAGVEASAERVRVRWRVIGESSARAQRREGEGEWRTVAELLTDGVGEMVLEDVAVSAGASYAYRLAFSGGSHAGETSVVVPRLELALAGARPNPAVGEVWVACTLPDATSARLELYDTVGRRRASRTVSGAGEHRVRLTDGALAPGLYWAVLRHGEHSRRARVVVAR